MSKVFQLTSKLVYEWVKYVLLLSWVTKRFETCEMTKWQTQCSYFQDVFWGNFQEFFVKMCENQSRQRNE